MSNPAITPITPLEGYTALELSEAYESACREANRLYTAGMDTDEIDALCDRIQDEMEARS
jgi:hypothetical protein